MAEEEPSRNRKQPIHLARRLRRSRTWSPNASLNEPSASPLRPERSVSVSDAQRLQGVRRRRRRAVSDTTAQLMSASWPAPAWAPMSMTASSSMTGMTLPDLPSFKYSAGVAASQMSAVVPFDLSSEQLTELQTLSENVPQMVDSSLATLQMAIDNSEQTISNPVKRVPTRSSPQPGTNPTQSTFLPKPISPPQSTSLHESVSSLQSESPPILISPLQSPLPELVSPLLLTLLSVPTITVQPPSSSDTASAGNSSSSSYTSSAENFSPSAMTSSVEKTSPSADASSVEKTLPSADTLSLDKNVSISNSGSISPDSGSLKVCPSSDPASVGTVPSSPEVNSPEQCPSTPESAPMELISLSVDDIESRDILPPLETDWEMRYQQPAMEVPDSSIPLQKSALPFISSAPTALQEPPSAVSSTTALASAPLDLSMMKERKADSSDSSTDRHRERLPKFSIGRLSRRGLRESALRVYRRTFSLCTQNRLRRVVTSADSRTPATDPPPLNTELPHITPSIAELSGTDLPSLNTELPRITLSVPEISRPSGFEGIGLMSTTTSSRRRYPRSTTSRMIQRTLMSQRSSILSSTRVIRRTLTLLVSGPQRGILSSTRRRLTRNPLIQQALRRHRSSENYRLLHRFISLSAALFHNQARRSSATDPIATGSASEDASPEISHTSSPVFSQAGAAAIAAASAVAAIMDLTSPEIASTSSTISSYTTTTTTAAPDLTLIDAFPPGVPSTSSARPSLLERPRELSTSLLTPPTIEAPYLAGYLDVAPLDLTATQPATRPSVILSTSAIRFVRAEASSSATSPHEMDSSSAMSPRETVSFPATTPSEIVSSSATSPPEMVSFPATSSPEMVSFPVTSSPEMVSFPVTSFPEMVSFPVTSSPEMVSFPVTSSPEMVSSPATSSPEMFSFLAPSPPDMVSSSAVSSHGASSAPLSHHPSVLRQPKSLLRQSAASSAQRLASLAALGHNSRYRMPGSGLAPPQPRGSLPPSRSVRPGPRPRADGPLLLTTLRERESGLWTRQTFNTIVTRMLAPHIARQVILSPRNVAGDAEVGNNTSSVSRRLREVFVHILLSQQHGARPTLAQQSGFLARTLALFFLRYCNVSLLSHDAYEYYSSVHTSFREGYVTMASFLLSAPSSGLYPVAMQIGAAQSGEEAISTESDVGIVTSCAPLIVANFRPPYTSLSRKRNSRRQIACDVAHSRSLSVENNRDSGDGSNGASGGPSFNNAGSETNAEENNGDGNDRDTGTNSSGGIAVNEGVGSRAEVRSSSEDTVQADSGEDEGLREEDQDWSSCCSSSVGKRIDESDISQFPSTSEPRGTRFLSPPPDVDGSPFASVMRSTRNNFDNADKKLSLGDSSNGPRGVNDSADAEVQNLKSYVVSPQAYSPVEDDVTAQHLIEGEHPSQSSENTVQQLGVGTDSKENLIPPSQPESVGWESESPPSLTNSPADVPPYLSPDGDSSDGISEEQHEASDDGVAANALENDNIPVEPHAPEDGPLAEAYDVNVDNNVAGQQHEIVEDNGGPTQPYIAGLRSDEKDS